MAQLFDYEADDGNVIEGLTITEALQLYQRDEEKKRINKQAELRDNALGAIDKTKQQLAQKNMSGGIAETLKGLNVSMPQVNGQTIQQPAKPSNLEQIQRMSLQRPTSTPITMLNKNDPNPQARELGQDLGNINQTSQMSNEDIYSQNGLTDRYSETPEVQNFLNSSRSQQLNKNISGLSQNISQGKYGETGKIDITKLSGDLANALSDAGLPEESIKTIQNVINNESKKVAKENQPFNMVGARLKYDTPEYRELITSQIDESLNGGKISQEQADFAKNQVANGFAYDYGLSFMKSGVDASLKRGVKVADEWAMNAPQAAGAAANTAATENKKREIQASNPVLSEAQGGALQDSYNAVGYLNRLKSAIQSGNIDLLDVTKAGQFKNPDIDNAVNQMVEIVGRKRSGAAISDSEWNNFRKQVLNRNYLLTDKGKTTALQNINDYLDRFYGAGVTTTGNEDWYNNYKGKSKSAREKAEGAPKPQVKSNSVGEALGKVPQAKIDLAKQALNDPEATSDEKARAMMILRNAGVQ